MTGDFTGWGARGIDHTTALGATTILASALSGYEIAWKFHLGKLDVPFQIPADCTRTWQQERWLELPLSLTQAIQAGRITSPHRDPFDRQLAAQAIHEDATLITLDPAFATFHGLTTLW
jgi:PIN domain nuclease of toxin-antitoxin system